MTSEPPASAVGLVLHPTKPADRSIETIIASIRGMPVRLLAREIDRHVPVLGVNHGNLGFLVEVAPDQLPSALKRLAAGDFCIEQYACLEVDAGGMDLAIRFG